MQSRRGAGGKPRDQVTETGRASLALLPHRRLGGSDRQRLGRREPLAAAQSSLPGRCLQQRLCRLCLGLAQQNPLKARASQAQVWAMASLTLCVCVCVCVCVVRVWACVLLCPQGPGVLATTIDLQGAIEPWIEQMPTTLPIHSLRSRIRIVTPSHFKQSMVAFTLRSTKPRTPTKRGIDCQDPRPMCRVFVCACVFARI